MFGLGGQPADQGQPQGPPGAQDDRNPCTQCLRTLPAVTKMLMGATLFGIIMYVAGVTPVLALCPSKVFQGFQIWRLVTASFATLSAFGSLFGLLTVFQYGRMIETRKGSMFLGAYIMYSVIFINTLFLLFVAAFGYGAKADSSFVGGDVKESCSAGIWPLAFAIIVIETSTAPEERRRFMCFPIDVPTKYYPLILFMFFLILLGINMASVFGLIAGYIYVHVERLQIELATLQRWEQSSWLQWLVNQQNFIHSDGATGVAATGGGWSGDEEQGQAPQSRGTHGSGTTGGSRISTISDAPQGDSRGGAAAPAKSSAFAGQGHSLAPSSTSSGVSGLFSSLGRSDSASAPSRPGAALAERMERLKKERKQKQQSRGSEATSSPAAASTPIPQPINPPPQRSSSSSSSHSSSKKKKKNKKDTANADSVEMESLVESSDDHLLRNQPSESESEEVNPFLMLSSVSADPSSAAESDDAALAGVDLAGALGSDEADIEEHIASLVELGFSRRDAARALEDSNGDLQVAMDKLVG